MPSWGPSASALAELGKAQPGVALWLCWSCPPVSPGPSTGPWTLISLFLGTSLCCVLSLGGLPGEPSPPSPPSRPRPSGH